MKHALKTVPIILILLLVLSCGERKSGVGSDQLYSIVSTLPPVGVFKHLDLHPEIATGYISADYIGLLVVDFSDPGNPVITDTLDNDFMGSIGSSYISSETGFAYIETSAEGSSNKGIKAFPLDSLETISRAFMETGSPPIVKMEIVEFFRDSLGAPYIDSLHLYICDRSELGKEFQRQHMIRYNFGGVTSFYTDYSDYFAYANVYDFVIVGDLAYLAMNEQGMTIIDMTTGFVEMGGFDTEGFCQGIDAEGDYCYLADRHWGLQVIDVSDPMNPVRAANLKFEGADDCDKVKIAGDRAVVLDRYDGVFAVDISNPANPRMIFNVDTITPTDIVVTEEYIYVLDEDAGLVVISW